MHTGTESIKEIDVLTRLLTGLLTRLRLGSLLVLVCLLSVGSAERAAADAPEVAVTPPVAGFTIANPGVIHTAESGWVVWSTGDWDTTGHLATADETAGPWTHDTTHALLTGRPSWAHPTDHSVWAPSIIRASDGTYVVFYAARVADTQKSRCIGTAHATSPTGPFTPNARALACFSGSGANAYDTIASEGPKMTVIDATPAWVGSTLVLTYKTGWRASDSDPWHTTTRMVRLDPDHPAQTLPNPVHADGGSIKISDAVNKYIEENPVMVLHDGRYTLFTSFGWFGTCDYSTRYRQNTDLWSGWLAKSPTSLSFPSGLSTCGTGNGQVTQGLPAGSWRIFFNGHSDGPHTPFRMYVGVVGWSDGSPKVTAML